MPPVAAEQSSSRAGTDAGSKVNNKDDERMFLAQTPDTSPDGTTIPGAAPIPPVVTGTVDLEEFKRINVIDLKVAQSRT
ncbi:hypothetical protein ABTP72_19560, partial [Acinetobacter baumannii]